MHVTHQSSPHLAYLIVTIFHSGRGMSIIISYENNNFLGKSSQNEDLMVTMFPFATARPHAPDFESAIHHFEAHSACEHPLGV